MAALLLPMAMNAETKDYVQLNKKASKVVVSSTPTAIKATKTVKFNAAGPKADVPEGYASVTLTAGDVWGDGSGYQMLLDADATAYGTIIPTQGALTTSGDVDASVYAEFEYKIPEAADGALSTTNIVINSSVNILIPAGTYDWCITNPTPGDRMWIASDNGSAGGRADDFEFVSGAAYEFQVTLNESSGNDQTDVIVDDPTAPVIPTGVEVTPTATTGEVIWVPGENNASWTLRWRPWVDPALMAPYWDLPIPGYEDQIEGFSIYDADGDGNNWGLAYTSDAQDDACFTSASYSGGALTPDNWLITPEVTLGGTLKFDVWQRSASYPDKIMVYVCDNPDWASSETFDADQFVAISEFIQPAGTTPETIELDLGAFEGTGVIAFRHYDCTDQWSIYLDNISVDFEGAAEPAEWTVVENVENPYTIEGLTPETKYEVQVQAANEEGRTTDWTEIVEFTTLAEDPVVVEEGFFLVGTFNGWNQTAEGGRIAFDEENRATVQLEANDEFKIITPAEDGGWIWLGGVDDNQVGYFLITPELMSYELDLIDGANFRVQEGGTYHINLIWERADLPAHIVVTLAEPDAISTIATDKVDNRIFDLMGRELKSVPETGIYIQNGKKYVK